MSFKFEFNKIFFIWYLSILIIFWLGYFYFPKGEMSSKSFFESLSNWDGKHYLSIASLGYLKNDNTAFFPLYPLAVKLLTLITQNYLLAALTVSGASFYLSLKVLFILVKSEFNAIVAKKTILALLFFPTSFFFLVAYSESLFFLFTVLAFYFLKKDKYLLCGLSCALASSTRLVGLALFGAILGYILVKKGLNKKNWVILLGSIGFLSYALVIYLLTGDPLYFIEVQKNWGRNITLPWISIWDSITTAILLVNFDLPRFSIIINLIFAVFGIGMSFRAFRFLSWQYSLYSLLSILIPVFSSTLLSLPRFILPIFPIFILIGLLKNKFSIQLYYLVSILLLIIFTVLYINGYWVS